MSYYTETERWKEHHLSWLTYESIDVALRWYISDACVSLADADGGMELLVLRLWHDCHIQIRGLFFNIKKMQKHLAISMKLLY